METNLQLVTLHDRATITNSKIVAEVFGKSHDDVLRAIRDLKNDVATGVAEEHLRKIAEMFPERLRKFGRTAVPRGRGGEGMQCAVGPQYCTTYECVE